MPALESEIRDELDELRRQRDEIEQRIRYVQRRTQRRKRDRFDAGIALLIEALTAFAHERGLSEEMERRTCAYVMRLDGVQVQLADDFVVADRPRLAVIVRDTVSNVRADFDSPPPPAALIGLIDGFLSARGS